MLGEGKIGAAGCLPEDSYMIYERLKSRQRDLKTIVALFLGMLLFKFSLDISYWLLMTQEAETFRGDFSPLKYALGLICCITLFFGIRHSQQNVSSFMLYLVFVLQFIPITTIYALGNDSTEYYISLFFAFLLCEVIVAWTKDSSVLERNTFISKTMHLGFVGITILTLALIILKNGVPSLTALNLLNVYELRSSGSFQLSKYGSYLLGFAVTVLLPMMITKCLLKKRYLLAGLSCGVIFLLYLYSGHKTYLFSFPLVVVGVLWAKRKNFYTELFVTATTGFSALSLLTCVFSDEGGILRRYLYPLFIRRTMLVPANNKFKYFDYFSQRPKMGLGGIFPRWLLPIENPYENIRYSYEISDIYYGKPEMNSNTGFLAEGYMRFGHPGTFLVLILFAILLKQMDKLQSRSSYALTLGIFIYSVFSLTDAHLLDSFVSGPWLILLFILILYKERASCAKESPLEYQKHTS